LTDDWSRRIDQRLGQVADQGRWRAPRTFDALGPAGWLEDQDHEVVSFASNDYLGLTAHPDVVKAAHRAIDQWGSGAGASRLVTGSRPIHAELEAEIARWKESPSAVLFPTGFAANLGVLSVLAGPGVTVLSDELNHASIVDGCRLAKGSVAIYRHADTGHLAHMLGQTAGPTIVVTDTVFSMDGDFAPLEAIAAVCREHGSLLVLDEAHAVLGPHPKPEMLEGLTVARVGTMSKTLGSLGGFVAGPTALIELLVNAARSYIFTTASTPADAAAGLAALNIVRSGEGERLCQRLASLVARVAPGHQSPIVPVVLGSEQRALDASAKLLSQGLWVPAIRPPTVPHGTSRLRVTLSAAHTDDQVSALIAGLEEVRRDVRGLTM
jgi:8-amino-7-oxononanoate synthase